MKYLFILLGSLLWAKPAYAYLDPGTGSLLFQSIIALIAGVAVVAKVYWLRIKNFFTYFFTLTRKKG